MRSFFESNSIEDSEHRYLNFIAYKHKQMLPENTRAEHNSHYYVIKKNIQSESDIRRIKKYQNNLNNLPTFGINFDFENKEEDS